MNIKILSLRLRLSAKRRGLNNISLKILLILLLIIIRILFI